MTERKTALVTGASSGIGRSTAKLLAREGYDLVLCGRRKERLIELADSLETVETTILVFDVRNRAEVSSSIESLNERVSKIDLLINNAGNAHGRDTLINGDLDDWDAMIDGNVQGLLYVSKATLPLMRNSDHGHIINISSVAGKETYANGVVYCASKHAVESISEGMRKELVPLGIKVTNIAPGAVETEFSEVRFKGDKEAAAKIYEGFEPLIADDIANAIMFCVQAPSHVQIADMTILPSSQYAATGIHKA